MPVETRFGNIGVDVKPGGSDLSFATDVSTSAVAILGTAPAMELPFEINKPTRIDEVNIDELGTDGTLPDAINDVLSQSGETGIGSIIVVPVAEGADEDATLANLAGDLAAKTGVYALLNSYSITSVQPGIIIAPEWTHQMPGGAKNPLVTALEVVCPKLMAHGVLDAPDGPSDGALDQADLNDEHYLTSWWPHVKVTRPAEMIRPPSGFVAGLLSMQEIALGVHYSVLNVKLSGISGLTQPVTFGTEDATATILGNRAVNSFVRGHSGFKSYGDETTSTSGEKQLYSLAVSRTRSYLLLTIKRYLEDTFLGKPMNGSFFSMAEMGVGRFMSRLQSIGVFLDYKFEMDKVRQTPEQTANRIANFKLTWVPAPPARNITVREFIETEITDNVEIQIPQA